MNPTTNQTTPAPKTSAEVIERVQEILEEPMPKSNKKPAAKMNNMQKAAKAAREKKAAKKVGVDEKKQAKKNQSTPRENKAKPEKAPRAPRLSPGPRTFALRVTDAELAAYKKTAGPGNGTQWARQLLATACGLTLEGEVMGNKVFRDPAEKAVPAWRVIFLGQIQSPSFNSPGAAQAFLDGLERASRPPETGTRTMPCIGCDQPITFVTGKGWVHPSGYAYATRIDACGIERDDHCATPRRS